MGYFAGVKKENAGDDKLLILKQDLEVAREDHTLAEARSIKIKSNLLPVKIRDCVQFQEEHKIKEANFNEFKKKMRERDILLKKIGVQEKNHLSESSSHIPNPIDLGLKIIEEHDKFGKWIFTKDKTKKSPVKKTKLVTMNDLQR